MLGNFQGIDPIGLSAPFSNSKTNNPSDTPNSHKNIEMIMLENFQGINPMGLSATLDDSKTNNSSDTPNSHKNIEMIV